MSLRATPISASSAATARSGSGSTASARRAAAGRRSIRCSAAVAAAYGGPRARRGAERHGPRRPRRRRAARRARRHDPGPGRAPAAAVWGMPARSSPRRGSPRRCCRPPSSPAASSRDGAASCEVSERARAASSPACSRRAPASSWRRTAAGASTPRSPRCMRERGFEIARRARRPAGRRATSRPRRAGGRGAAQQRDLFLPRPAMFDLLLGGPVLRARRRRARAAAAVDLVGRLLDRAGSLFAGDELRRAAGALARLDDRDRRHRRLARGDRARARAATTRSSRSSAACRSRR